MGVGLFVWSCAVLGMFGWMTSYSFEASVPGQPDANHPHDLAERGSTLFLSVHPRCACTAATYENLSRLATRCGDRLTIRVLVYRPSDGDSDWDDGAARRFVRGLPNASHEWDDDGLRSSRLGARTSGSVVLFGSDGQVRYNGGVTLGRGHAGANSITDALHRVVMGEEVRTFSGPVFGCPIVKESS